VVDQLEELFVGGFSSELRQRYFAALGALVKWRVAFVIMALRSDFYASFEKCCTPKDLAVGPEFRVRDIDLSEVLKGRFDLYSPSPQEIGEMIRLPAEAIGLRFELDPETGQNLDVAMLEAATACSEPLPALEHALWQLYRKQLLRKDGVLRWSDYRESGELEGALANHAESVFSALDGDAQAALKPIVGQLVSPGPGEEGVLVRRTVSFRDLTSTPEFSERQKTGAERLIDRFIKEGLFHAESGRNAEVLVSVTQEYLLRNWPRVRQLLSGDIGLLRVRDRLEANFRLWLSRGRKNRDLLSTGPGTSEAETLLRSFRESLSATQVYYIQRSLKVARGRHRLWGGTLLALGAGLAIFLTILAATWLNAMQTQLKETAAKAQQAQANMGVVTKERDALQAQLKETVAKAQQAQANMDLVTKERDALQTQLKETVAKAQQAQANMGVVTKERDALQAQLKGTEADAQETQKKVQQEKAQLVQKIADPVAVPPQAKNGGRSNAESAQNGDFIANKAESAQTQPPNAGWTAEAVASTQPLGSSVRPTGTPSMSSLASAPIEAPTPKNEPIVGVEQRNR
jgi:hypothetical protein